MATPAAVLTIVVEANTKAAQAQLVKLQSELKASGLAASSSMAKTATATSTLGSRLKAQGTAAQKFGRTMSTHVGLPLAAVGAVAIKMGMDFQRSMELISTQAGASEREVRRMSKAVLDLAASGQVEQGPQELAQALFHIESAGLRGRKAMRALKASADLAAVGQADLEQTTNALVGALNTGIKGAKNMRQAIGVMNATVGAGNMRMDELTGAMGTGFLASARQVGLSLTDVGGALATMTRQGIPAQQTATRLRMSFGLMAAPTDKAKTALEEIGLSSEDLAVEMRKPNGLVNAIGLLKEHLDGLSKVKQTQVLSEAFGGARSGTTMMALVQNFSRLRDVTGQIAENTGRFNEKLRETRRTPAFRMQALMAKLEATMTRLGIKLLPRIIPLLTRIGNAVADVIDWFSKLPGGTQAWIIKLSLVLVALGPIVGTLGTIIRMIGTIAGMSIFNTAAVSAEGAAAGAAAGNSFLVGLGRVVPLAGAAILIKAVYDMTPSGTHISTVGNITREHDNVIDQVKQTAHDLFGIGNAPGEAEEILTNAAYDFGGKRWQRVMNAFNRGLPAVGHRTARQLRSTIQEAIDAGASGADLAPLRKKLRQIQGLVAGAGGRVSRSDFGNELKALKSGLVVQMSDINKVLRRGLREANQGWVKGTHPWRVRVAAAMRAASDAILTGMRRGTIGIKEGTARMAALLQRANLLDPTRRWSRQFGEIIGNTWAKAHGATTQGIRKLIAETKKMPPAMRDIAVKAMLDRINIARKEGDLTARQYAKIRSRVVVTFDNMNTVSRLKSKQAMTGVIGNIVGLATGVLAGLQNIKGNTQNALKAFNVKPIAIPLITMGRALGFRAEGGMIGGQGRRDTVPIMAAPGEAVLNRHQQPHVERAMGVAKAMGIGQYGSLGELFAGERTPHYMAKGGKVTAPRLANTMPPLTIAGQNDLNLVAKAASKFVAKQRPHFDYHGEGTLSVGQFLSAAREALRITGHAHTPGGARKLLILARQESGLRVNPPPPHDINWQQGNPSMGLMQITGSNFRAYHEPKTSRSIIDPLANIAASINYQFDPNQYGGLVTHSPYARGGFVERATRPVRRAARRARRHLKNIRPEDARPQSRKRVAAASASASASSAWHNTDPRTENRVYAVANKVNRAHFPYVLGGGHSGTPAPFGPFDCSGAVSYLLQQSGYGVPTAVSGAMTGWGRSGDGWLSIHTSPEHVIAVINGKEWGTSNSNPGGGAGWISGHQARSPHGSAWVRRHFPVGGAASRAQSGPSEAQLQRREQRRKAHARIERRTETIRKLYSRLGRHVTTAGGGVGESSGPLEDVVQFWHYFRKEDPARWKRLEEQLDKARTRRAREVTLRQMVRYARRNFKIPEAISGHTIEALRKEHGPMPGYDTPQDRRHEIRHRTALLGRLKFNLLNAVKPKERRKALDALRDFWSEYGVFGPQEIKPKRSGPYALGPSRHHTADLRATARRIKLSAYSPQLKGEKHVSAERKWIRFAEQHGRISGAPEDKLKDRIPKIAKAGKIDQAERISNLQELLRLANLRLAVSERQGKVLELPTMHSGGRLAGGPFGAERVYVGKVGETVRTPAQERALAPSEPKVSVVVHGDILSDRADPIEVRVDDKRIDAAVERSLRRPSRRASRPLAGRGGGRI